jgi:hypothetical protein
VEAQGFARHGVPSADVSGVRGVSGDTDWLRQAAYAGAEGASSMREKHPFQGNMTREEFERATAHCACQTAFFKPTFPEGTHAKNFIVCVCCGRKHVKPET